MHTCPHKPCKCKRYHPTQLLNQYVLIVVSPGAQRRGADCLITKLSLLVLEIHDYIRYHQRMNTVYIQYNKYDFCFYGATFLFLKSPQWTPSTDRCMLCATAHCVAHSMTGAHQDTNWTSAELGKWEPLVTAALLHSKRESVTTSAIDGKLQQQTNTSSTPLSSTAPNTPEPLAPSCSPSLPALQRNGKMKPQCWKKNATADNTGCLP